MNPDQGCLFPFACFRCRRSFKRSYKPGVEERPCPNCGGVAVRLSRKFKAPPADNGRQWAKVEYFVSQGFRFESLRNPDGTAATYPGTLREAEEFVRLHGPSAAPRPHD